MSDTLVTENNQVGSGALREDRIERFMALTYEPAGREDENGEQMTQTAFTRKEAEVLAEVTVVDEVKIGQKDLQKIQYYERPLHPSKVKKMLDQGCHPKMVLRILGD